MKYDFENMQVSFEDAISEQEKKEQRIVEEARKNMSVGFFRNFSEEQIRRQYADNVSQFILFSDKAKAKGGKYNKKTAAEWSELANEYEILSRKFTWN